ncbi:MAG: hypothetical protein KDC12_11385, partial [Flavobacteriales bacterium]|nr:hypothetical protein [Flavobacteriales bacterium]
MKHLFQAYTFPSGAKKIAMAGLVFVFCGVVAQGQKIRNLTLGPCNYHGISYCGVLLELEENHVLDYLERVGGEHGGAIPAVLIAVGFSPQEVTDILMFTDFSEFIPLPVEENQGNGVLRNREAFRFWLQSHIARKTGSATTTFAELHKNRNRWKGFDLFISSEIMGGIVSYESRPDMPLIDAVMSSYSTMHDFHSKEPQSDRFAAVSLFDGPEYYNELTVMAFDKDFKNPQTVGLRIVCDDNGPAHRDRTCFDREIEVMCPAAGGEMHSLSVDEKSRLLLKGR